MAALREINRLQLQRNDLIQLTRRAFSHFGQRLDGMRLSPEPATWLSGQNGHTFPKPNPDAQIRPADMPLLEWLQQQN